jgi:hypothetical protein
LQTQLIISESLGFGSKKQRDAVEHLSSEASRMLFALIKKLKRVNKAQLAISAPGLVDSLTR